jgi:gluconolactonase
LLLGAAVMLTAAGAQTAPVPPPLPPTVADGAKLETLFADDRFFEGPTWDPATKRLYVSAFGSDNQQVLQLDPAAGASSLRVWMDQTKGVAHTCLSREGRLLAAQAYGHQVLSLKIGEDGPMDQKVLSKGCEGVPFLRPTDVAESPTTGRVYIADPNFEGKTRSGVFLIDAAGRTRRIIDHLKQPTGLEVSNDGKTLFVSDSFEKRIYAYPILDDGDVDQSKVRIFFDPETTNTNDADGMCSDADGNMYFAMRGGVWVANPQGQSLGLIPITEFCSNASFGGEDGKTLFITAAKGVHQIRMRVKGR